MQQLLRESHTWDEKLHVNFEDDRQEKFKSSDFHLILECFAELSDKRPMLFLDEIQNIDGWEKFARHLADNKYNVYITRSNAKMLSREVMTTLGGRYLSVKVYPFSFIEQLDVSGQRYDENSLLQTDTKAKFMRQYNDYLHWGGLPESVGLPVKRDYVSSTFQKVYLGNICVRIGINNLSLLRLMLKKNGGKRQATIVIQSYLTYSLNGWWEDQCAYGCQLCALLPRHMAVAAYE